MGERAGFGADLFGFFIAGEAAAEGAVLGADGEEGGVLIAVGGCVHVLQEGDDGSGADEVLAGEAGAVLEVGFFVGVDLGGFEEVVHALLAFSGAADELGVEVLADFVDDLEELGEGRGIAPGQLNGLRGLAGFLAGDGFALDGNAFGFEGGAEGECGEEGGVLDGEFVFVSGIGFECAAEGDLGGTGEAAGGDAGAFAGSDGALDGEVGNGGIKGKASGGEFQGDGVVVETEGADGRAVFEEAVAGAPTVGDGVVIEVGFVADEVAGDGADVAGFDLAGELAQRGEAVGGPGFFDVVRIVAGGEAGVALAEEDEVALEYAVLVGEAGGKDLGGETEIGAEGGQGKGGGEEFGVGGGNEELVFVPFGEDLAVFGLDGVDAPVDAGLCLQDFLDFTHEGLGAGRGGGETDKKRKCGEDSHIVHKIKLQ